jgi:hypothetical protein
MIERWGQSEKIVILPSYTRFAQKWLGPIIGRS